MKNGRMLIVMIGVLMMFFAFFYSISPRYHMSMMHGGVDYTPYILFALGIFLILIPFLEASSNRESTVLDSSNLWDKLKLAEKLLNEDEAMILRLIHENEGITQDSIHFKTGFSHSKISVIMKKLEEKDLIVREKFGKTYKLYLSEWLNGEKEN